MARPTTRLPVRPPTQLPATGGASARLARACAAHAAALSRSHRNRHVFYQA